MDGDPEPVLDPGNIQTLEELAREFTRLAGLRPRSSLTKAATALPVRDGRQPALPKSTLSDLLGGRSMPSRDTVVTYLTVCGLSTGRDQQPWLAAWERVSNAHLRRPTGAVQVREARARLLGVHAAFQADLEPRSRDNPNEPDPATVDGVEEELPVYVPRDFDVDLRTKLTMARECGGFVLLTGDSSVGKTRALFQALRDVVPEWWLLHPADAPAVDEFAAAPTARTVVWLDELQNYLNHAAGLRAAAITRLVAAGAVVVATLWPGENATRTAPGIPGQPDRYANDRQLLRLADIVAVPGEFSAAERRRAEELADTDRRIRIALDTRDAGVTQVMAGGPQLVRHWEHAPAEQCYGKAVITAALDARRVGAYAPVTREYLEAAAPGYLTGRQQAAAPHDWLDHGLAYATTSLHGATATLTPIPAGMGQIAGYQVADYLHQHALNVRRTTHLPDAAWDALVRHHNPDDTYRLADNAERRGRYSEAEVLYRRADTMLINAENSYLEANPRLRFRGGRDSAAQLAFVQLANMLAARNRGDEAIKLLRSRESTSVRCAGRLESMFYELDKEEELTLLAEGDSVTAFYWLVNLMIKQGRTDEAIALLRRRADTSQLLNWRIETLADLLMKKDQVDEALTLLRTQIAAGNRNLVTRLPSLLAKCGRVDEALTLLRAEADGGNIYAASKLAELLADVGGIEELTQRANSGDEPAQYWLADWSAVQLAQEGRIDEAVRLLEYDYKFRRNPRTGQRIAELLAEHGRIEELTRRADNGDTNAARQLIDLLVDQNRFDELAAEIAAGTPGATVALRASRMKK